jgi:KaiC/GvpD/RAD55 family RecA-like ATPase
LDRVSTGITGLDPLIGGGIPKGSSILVTGSAGTGKTVLALHFINAACSIGKKAAYVAVEESRQDLVTQAASFGWDFDDFEKRGLLRIATMLEERMVEAKYQYDTLGPEMGFGGIVEAVGSDAEVVVIDNLGILALEMTLSHFRQQLDYLIYTLGYRGCTTMIITDEATLSRFGEVASYAVDGAIRLLKRDNPYTDMRERALEIVKIRHSKHSIDYITFDIDETGIRIEVKSTR